MCIRDRVEADDILVAFDITMLGVLTILAVCQQTGRCKREIAALKGVEQVQMCIRDRLPPTRRTRNSVVLLHRL